MKIPVEKKRKRGRPSYVPTEKDRSFVQVMASVGTYQEQIAKTLGIDGKTLRKHFADVLEGTTEKANAQVISTLFRMATSGDCPAATFFWLKTRMGWRDVTTVEMDVRQRVDVRAVVLDAMDGQPEETRRLVARKLLESARGQH